MSILDAFDDGEALVLPKKLIPKVEGFPSHVIGVFQQQLIEALKKNYRTKIISSVNAGIEIPIYKITENDIDFAVYRSPIGAPTTGGLMEEVIAKGGTKFLFFGACGVLDKDISVGHFILPTDAYREEGMSYHYAAPSDYIEVPTVKALKRAFDKNNIPYITGKTWTTDAFYRETKSKMQARKKEGCIAVEMECAAIMAVARFRGVEAYQYLYAEDTLDGTKWDPRSMGQVQSDVYEKYLSIGLKIFTDL